MRDRREQALATRAASQQGVWTLQQALECGFTRPAIRRRLQSGRWEEVAPRVYRATQATPPDPRQLLRAQLFASAGVASGRSAAGLYGWLPFPAVPEITVLRTARRNSHRSVHITDKLPSIDVTSVEGFPATTPIRTLIDLGSALRRDRFEDLFDEVLVTGSVQPQRLEARARELLAPRRRGCGIVLQLLEESNPELTRARNGWEAKVLRAISRFGLPSPRVNYRVRVGGRTRYIDLAWPEAMGGGGARRLRSALEASRLRRRPSPPERPCRGPVGGIPRDVDGVQVRRPRGLQTRHHRGEPSIARVLTRFPCQKTRD
jgi:hypothetical protein